MVGHFPPPPLPPRYADEALKDVNGKPVANQARNTQLARRFGLSPVAA